MSLLTLKYFIDASDSSCWRWACASFGSEHLRDARLAEALVFSELHFRQAGLTGQTPVPLQNSVPAGIGAAFPDLHVYENGTVTKGASWY
jgi:hypothetical protein